MNRFEAKLKRKLQRENPDHKVLRNGWPDFLVISKTTGKIIKAIEAKLPGSKPTKEQRAIHSALNNSGILTEVVYERELKYILKLKIKEERKWVMTRLEESLWKKLQARAKRNDRSMSSEISLMVRKHFEGA